MSALILAIPSKGRLEEAARDFFARGGLSLTRQRARGYQGGIAGLEAVRVEYVAAGEIAERLATGAVHFGVTGEDLLRETIPDIENAVQLCLPLGFGRADLVVAVPDGWVDVTTMFDLAEIAAEFHEKKARPLRVATKYTQLAADFFARHAIGEVQFVPSFGATEAAPDAGAAEAIVDITSSGATLAANGLRILDDGLILKSEARLAAAYKADWTAEPVRGAARIILGHLAAHLHARAHVELRFTAASELPPICAGLAQDSASTHYAAGEQNIYTLIVPRIKRDAVLAELAAQHIAVTVSQPDLIFAPRNTAYEQLMGAV